MRKVWVAIRYSSMGVFFAGVISFIQGCSQDDINFAFLLWLIMMLFGGGGEEAAGPPPVTEIVMYSAGTSNGNLGGRAGADATCLANKPGTLPASYTKFHAFISVDNTTPDLILNMPANYGVPTNLPIVGATGTIDNSWAELLSGNILITLQAAGVATSNWWSGSNAFGGLGASNCSAWTKSAGLGTKGVFGSTAASWMNDFTASCASTLTLLCLAY